ncbi:MAG: hypothetical protein LBH72_03185 [Proteiniphilum sp.]|jgi:hypothetical protein|nr:hypothetical protein [Proteiniphilum sp.]
MATWDQQISFIETGFTIFRHTRIHLFITSAHPARAREETGLPFSMEQKRSFSYHESGRQTEYYFEDVNEGIIKLYFYENTNTDSATA